MDESAVIDLNDILSEKLMPASLFFMSSPVEPDVISEFRTLDNETDTVPSSYDGTFGNAYSTMGFHRLAFFFFCVDWPNCFVTHDWV